MFALFKQDISAKVYAHETWLFCCDCAQTFYEKFKRKLKAAGYLRTPTEDQIFMAETMRLHLWVISNALGDNDHNVLEQLHNHAHGLNVVNSKTLRELYVIYNEAIAKEIEAKEKGVGWPVLASTAIGQLVNNKAHAEVVIADEVHSDLSSFHAAICETRSKFKISKV